jgi:hypothetical protein
MYSPTLGHGYVIMTNANNGAAWQMTQVIMSYLLKESKKKISNEIPLSAKLKTIPGIYIPLSLRIEITRFSNNINGAMKISASYNKIHRSPVFGSWESNDYAVGENLLVNPWTGLPSIALVNDPIAGEALQIEGDLYKRITGFIFYGGVALISLLLLLIFVNIIFAMIWLPRMMLEKIAKGATIKIRTWPLLASLALITTFIFIFIFIFVYGNNVIMGTMNWVTIFISSILYPAFTIISLVTLYKYRNEDINKLVYINSLALSALNALLAIYLTYYGITGFMSWAV